MSYIKKSLTILAFSCFFFLARADSSELVKTRDTCIMYSCMLGLGYVSGLIPPLAPPLFMTAVMGAANAPEILKRRNDQRIGARLMYTYGAGSVLGFSTLLLGTYKLARWITKSRS